MFYFYICQTTTSYNIPFAITTNLPFSCEYSQVDKVINFSSIFGVKDKNDSYALELFNKDKGIYNYYILDDKNERIHLNTEIELKYLDNKLIEDIIKYLSEEHELTNYLNSIYE